MTQHITNPEVGPALLTPLERLARSRQAVVNQLHRNDRRPETYRDDEGNYYSSDPRGPTFSTDDGIWPMLRRAGTTWWHFHPARRAVLMAEPAISEFARAKPWPFIGIAAGLGAAVVIVRPWKLLSLSGLALAALRSSELSSVALALVTSTKNKYSTGSVP